MNRRLAGIITWLLLAVPAMVAADDGDWILWRVAASDTLCPAIETVRLATVAAEDVDGVRYRWIRIDVRSAARDLFAFALLAPADTDDPFARAGIRRYVLLPPAGAPLEYVEGRTGAARLPGFEPWNDLVPRGSDPSELFPSTARFAGRELREAARGNDATLRPPGDPKRVVLDPEVIVATGRSFRDDGRGRAAGGDWTWVPLDGADYRTMIAAGFNLFNVTPRDLPFVLEEPVFFTMAEAYREHPELPWRSNYVGAYFYADEPAIRTMRDGSLRGATSLPEIDDRIATATRRTLEGAGPYGRGFLGESAAKTGCSFGSLRPTWCATWEAVASAATAEFEGGASAFCWESRLRPDAFAAQIRRILDVRFPADARSCIAYHLALLRGPSRECDAPWGVSVYGQMDAAAADLLFPMAYDAGASLFWLWTSDGDHHVPFARQIELVTRLRDYRRSRPRAGGAQARTRSAGVAICVPRGCPLDELALADSGTGIVWGQSGIDLRGRDPAMADTRAMIAAAIRTAVTLLERGSSFDIVPMDPGHSPTGYASIVRVSPEGRVDWESH